MDKQITQEQFEADVTDTARNGPGRGVKAALETFRSEVDSRVKRRSGKLSESFEATAGDGIGAITSDAPQVDLLDQGGTVKPRGSWLTLPLPGQPKDPPAGLKLVIIRGSPMLAAIKGRRMQPKYALKKRVDVGARHFLDPAADAADQIVEAKGAKED